VSRNSAALYRELGHFYAKEQSPHPAAGERLPILVKVLIYEVVGLGLLQYIEECIREIAPTITGITVF